MCCVGIPAGAFFSEKMTSLEIFDMYLVIFDINNQYLIEFSQYLVKINQYLPTPNPPIRVLGVGQGGFHIGI